MFSRLRSYKLSPFYLPSRVTLVFVCAESGWLQQSSESLPGCACKSRKLLVRSVSLYFISTEMWRKCAFVEHLGAEELWHLCFPACFGTGHSDNWCWQGRDWSREMRGIETATFQKSIRVSTPSKFSECKKSTSRSPRVRFHSCFGVFYANNSSFLFQCFSAL